MRFRSRNFLYWILLCGATGSATVPVVPPAVLSQDFGTVAVNGSVPGTATVSYQFSGLSSIPSFTLVGLTDFALGHPSCTGSTAMACTLLVTFSPTFPGLRQDAIRVLDSGGNLLATTLLHGIGVGPQLLLLPGLITNFAGNGVWADTGDNGLAISATMGNPQGLAIDSQGNAYIADSLGQVVRKVDGATKVITTVAGNPTATALGDGGLAISAGLNAPTGIAVDGAGNFYIADSGNNRVRRVDAVSRLITTVAGNGTASDSLGDGGPATSASLSGPADIALDQAGNLYIADRYHHRVRKMDLTGTITTVAGGGIPGLGADGLGNGGPAINAQLSYPSSIAFDNAGNFYIADTGNHLIREVNSGIISVVAGNGSPNYSGDGYAAINASVGNPKGVRVDAAGNVYIADSGNNVVRRVDAAGVINTLAGVGGQFGFSGNGGPPTSAQMSNLGGVALDSAGNIYIADLGNHVVRWITPGTGSLSFPATNIGATSTSLTLTIANIGNQSLNFSALALSGAFIQQSSGATDCAPASTIPAGTSCSIAVAFAPQSAGSVSGSLTFTTNSLNAAGGDVHVFALNGSGTGSGTAASDPAVNPGFLAFSNQVVGQSIATQVVTLSNPGPSLLNITGIWLAGSNVGDFATSTMCSSTLGAHQSCPVSVTFTPLGTGPRSATLTLREQTGQSSFDQSVFLSGTGTVPSPVVSPGVLSFSDGGPGSLPVTQTVTLFNPTALTLYIISIWPSGSTDFSITSNTCQSGLAPNKSCTVSVTFAPRATGLENAALNFTDSIAGLSSAFSQTVSIDTASPVVSLIGQTGSFAAQTRGTSSLPIPIQLKNFGNGALGISAINITGTNASDFGQVNNCGSSLRAGQGCIVWVTYSPTGNSPVLSTANLTITDDAPGSPHSITISGKPTGLSQAVICIDTPGAGSTVSGTIPLSGWALSDNATITAVSIAVDGVVVSSATYGTSRPDVCGVYPDRPSCPNVGWSAPPLITTKLAEGLHQLTVTTSSNQGSTTVSSPFSVSNLTSTVRTATTIDIDQPNTLTRPLTGSALFQGWAIDDRAAIQSVTLAVDGVPLKQAAYNVRRPDVCAVFPGRAGCPTVGWFATVDTTQISDGTHALAVTAQTADSRFSTTTANFTVANGSASPIILCIDSPANTPVSGTFRAAGWAVDVNSTIASVQISIDGVVQGIATPGSRPDVCAAFPNSQGCPNVGWSNAIDTTQLSDGVHTLGLMVTSADLRRQVVTKQFTISNLRNPSLNTINAWIDAPNANSGVLSGQVAVGGWAVDQVTGISGVELSVDGIPFTTVQTPNPRPDVCVAFPASLNCPNVGWQASLDTTVLTNGQHTFQMIAKSLQGRRIIRTVGFVSSNVNLWNSRGEVVNIDTQRGSAAVSGQITVSGWAVNKLDQVQALSITVDGVTVGTAQYGGARPDVCALYQSPANCPNVGWSYTLDTLRLTNGAHTLQAIEFAGIDNVVAAQVINVANSPNSMKLCIDLPSANSRYGGTVQLSGWAIDDTDPISIISVSVDGLPLGLANYGSSRLDVCSVYPNRAGCPDVGWKFLLDTTEFVNGNHMAQITGRSSSGHESAVSVPFTITN